MSSGKLVALAILTKKPSTSVSGGSSHQAVRYSHRVIIMKKGDIVADGKPEDIINEEIINNVYNVRCVINKEPVSNKLHIYPLEVSY